MGKRDIEQFDERRKNLLSTCKDFWRSPDGCEAIRNATSWENRNETYKGR